MTHADNDEKKQQEQQDKGMSSEVTLTSGIMVLCGGAAIILSVWVAIVTSMIGSTIIIGLNADGYSEAVFTIDSLHYVEGDRNVRNTMIDTYWAEGTINGVKEKYNLSGYIEDVIHSQEELEKYVSVGQELRVLYNPDVPQHLDIRVQYPEKNFKSKIHNRLKRMLKSTYMLWGIANVLCLFFGLIGRKIKVAIGLFITSCLFVFFGLIPTFWNILL